MKNTNILCVLILVMGLISCGCRSNRNRVTHRETVTDTLKNFIAYQEEADKEKIASLIVSQQRKVFLNSISEASRDDLIQASIDFAAQKYVLQELDDSVAVFWSEKGKKLSHPYQ